MRSVLRVGCDEVMSNIGVPNLPMLVVLTRICLCCEGFFDVVCYTGVGCWRRIG